MSGGAGAAVGARLRERIPGFVAYLREGGVPVGVGAELDFAAAFDTVVALDLGALRDASGTTLAKSPEELRFVRAAFDRYWGTSEPRVELPWAGDDVAAVRPPKSGAPRPARRPADAVESAEPTVVVPVGTYSATAPASGHPLALLPDREMRRIRHGVRRFRRASATYPGRRRDPDRAGAVDLRDTVRRSLHLGGEWVELRRRRARPTRAEFVVLWDVSGSMREHDSRLFALVHALESLARRSRIFAFSTRLTEITDDVRRYGYRRATAMVGRRIGRADGGTRIGRSLEEFSQRYARGLGPRTTLVVLSDGWDLGEADRVGEELARLRRRVGRIVWVTPYTRRPGFRPEVGALRSARGMVDELLGPEDFESRWPLRPFAG